MIDKIDWIAGRIRNKGKMEIKKTLAQIMVTEEVEKEKRVLAGEEQRRVISLQVGIGHEDHDHI